jgi:abequosyltransferase
MNKLLTIAIPTYNRAELLDKQLAWLSQAITGFESDCEILISDNCSTDHTQNVIKKWQDTLSQIEFQSNKNPENIGLMNNIAFCLQAATGKYVWTIGDDDPIQERTLAYLLTTLKKHSNLTLMFLNCSGRDKITDQIIVERWFNSDNDQPYTDGQAVFQRYLKESLGGVLFITATIYRTEIVQRALQQWPSSCTNLASQAYWTGFCAAHGNVIVTKDTYLECTMHASYLERDPKLSLMMQFIYIPEIYLKLLQIGYSKKFCRQMVLHNISRKNDWKILLGALKRWPLSAINIIISYFTLIASISTSAEQRLFSTKEVKTTV